MQRTVLPSSLVSCLAPWLLAGMLGVLCCRPLLAGQDVAGEPQAPDHRADAPADGSGQATLAFQRYPDAPSVTEHEVAIGPRTIRYRATADTLTLVDADGTPQARIFYVAYTALGDPARDAGQAAGQDHRRASGGDRPITFCFNGGPGSSSVWLHLGLFGPRRVRYADEAGHPGPPPYAVVPNAYSLLDKTDLVFIDPVSTGYSRAEPGTSEKRYHGLESDLDAVAEFIRLYLTREGRWSSRKVIAGESYGTTRAAGLVQRLHARHGISVTGVVLISPVLEFQTIRFGPGNDLPYAMYLPSYTAVAHHHGVLPARWQEAPVERAVAEAERFALERYLPALLRGASLGQDEYEQVRATLAELTGLSEALLDDARLRVDQGRFCKWLLRERGQTVGRLDGRFVGIDADDAGERPEYDASYEAIRSNYTEAMNDYVRGQLGYRSDLPYEILASLWPWDYGSAGRDRYVSVADRLRDAMHRQPYMRVFVAMGSTDLATPFFAARTTLNRLALFEGYRDRIVTATYPAGHMMYVHRPSLQRLKADLDAFYDALP
ncbi:MAG: peptidase S10 [Phycisphaerales bacterium]|nr:MAG: peptidase S10 [Phycisphaerales bacterium]